MKVLIDQLLDDVAWREVHIPDDQITDGIPYATHTGVLKIPGVGEFRAYQLNTGERILNREDVEQWLREGKEQ